MEYFWYGLVIVAATVVMLAVWRFYMLRSSGSLVILRSMPAQGAHGWRHGLIRYNGAYVEYYKLRSLSPVANIAIDRQHTNLIHSRQPTSHESEFMEPGTKIVDILVGDTEFEIAMDSRSEMAFTAWLESAPSARLERADPREAIRHLTQKRNAT
ncbi:DUF2550 domain-containing protein [Corynebacterium sp.]|uniref:DUF2550 domain-containing protein n=1 Tax=Corynebacterium sp. TaxID=1720 RepID=UPI0026DB8923|nr:DUF2550 domain-containing protein [Corynebacterium sp.]MDO5076596.1 DUF2550 domain-containing protein [Corynebacterium sp.]